MMALRISQRQSEQSHDRFINNKYSDMSMCTYSSLGGLSSHKHKIWKKMKEGQKLYNGLHLTVGHAMIFANICRASTQPVFGVFDKADSNQCPYLHRLARRAKIPVAILDMILYKTRMTKVLTSLRGACEGWYASLLLANHRRQGFSRRGPVELRKYWDKQC